MHPLLRNVFAFAGVAFATQAGAQVTFYEREGFAGRSFTTQEQIGNLDRLGFNDRASSVEVFADRWEVCEDARFSGRCVVLSPGRYPSLAAMGLNNTISSVRSIGRSAPPPPPAPMGPQITFYERSGFQGQAFATDQQVGNLERFGFNDRASSVEVSGGRWEVCEDAGFTGRCVVLGPGRYPSLAETGLNNRISSVRSMRDARIDDRSARAPVTGAVAAYDYRRRPEERLYEANVTSVRAVVGPPEQRCWVEREQVVPDRGDRNVPGAVVGAVIGGILGHQIGGGRGRDIATVGGAVAGAAVGSNVGRDRGQAYAQDVQRCERVPSQARPDHWDVTYSFRGQEHRVQMTDPPGPTVTVNEQGEPRR